MIGRRGRRSGYLVVDCVRFVFVGTGPWSAKRSAFSAANLRENSDEKQELRRRRVHFADRLRRLTVLGAPPRDKGVRP
jgi:hypothetical protein